MSATQLQLFAVSALIGECRALASSGVLNPSQAAALCCLINHTQSAFEPKPTVVNEFSTSRGQTHERPFERTLDR
jgi:hypothetical protein